MLTYAQLCDEIKRRICEYNGWKDDDGDPIYPYNDIVFGEFMTDLLSFGDVVPGPDEDVWITRFDLSQENEKVLKAEHILCYDKAIKDDDGYTADFITFGYTIK